jgi:hypothetical protein
MRILLPLAVSLSFAGCHSPNAVQPAPTPEPAAQKPEDAKPDDGKATQEKRQKDEARKQKQKDLRGKQRELDYAKVEAQTAEIDRRVRTLAIDAALQRTGAELEKAKAELDLFLKELKPREIEEKKISLDQSTYRAEHSKDELGELVAMYEADEFARTTKELVLKRGRRELEMADRYLAVAKKESAHLEQWVLPQRERELRQKVADAELERRKAETERDKARVEMELAIRKASDRHADLEEDIRDLQETLAKETP